MPKLVNVADAQSFESFELSRVRFGRRLSTSESTFGVHSGNERTLQRGCSSSASSWEAV